MTKKRISRIVKELNLLVAKAALLAQPTLTIQDGMIKALEILKVDHYKNKKFVAKLDGLIEIVRKQEPEIKTRYEQGGIVPSNVDKGYDKVFWSSEDKAYIATVEKYPSMSGIGDTKEEAIEQLKIAMKGIEEVKS